MDRPKGGLERKTEDVDLPSGDTGGDVTARSRLLLHMHQRVKWVDEPAAPFPWEIPPTDDEVADGLKLAAQYFEVYEPPPSASSRLLHLQNVIVPKITFNDASHSVGWRGKSTQGKNKVQLVDELVLMLRLEEEVLGPGTSSKFRALEKEVNTLLEKSQKRKAQDLQDEIRAEWLPVKDEEEQRDQMQKDNRFRAVVERETQQEQRYWEWRDHSWQERLNLEPLVVTGTCSPSDVRQS